MQDLSIFAIASQRTQWLAARGSALANNIANADTPGFKARDVVPFETVLSSAGLQMSQTGTGHMAPAGAETKTFDTVQRLSSQAKHSGNTVSLDTELMGLGDVRSQHSTVTGVVGAFHRLLLSVAKG
jgi:flagellar basal-body rod protein FlgB